MLSLLLTTVLIPLGEAILVGAPVALTDICTSLSVTVEAALGLVSVIEPVENNVPTMVVLTLVKVPKLLSNRANGRVVLSSVDVTGTVRV